MATTKAPRKASQLSVASPSRAAPIRQPQTTTAFSFSLAPMGLSPRIVLMILADTPASADVSPIDGTSPPCLSHHGPGRRPVGPSRPDGLGLELPPARLQLVPDLADAPGRD